jgi:hypothetical protein
MPQSSPEILGRWFQKPEDKEVLREQQLADQGLYFLEHLLINLSLINCTYSFKDDFRHRTNTTLQHKQLKPMGKLCIECYFSLELYFTIDIHTLYINY